MAILEALERHEGFTNLEAELAEYIVKHADDVVNMNISDLAKASYTSNATIIRLCRKVGSDGYRSFRVGLASEVEKRRGLAASNVDADRPFGEGEGVKSVVASIAELSKEAIDTCYTAVDAYDIQRVAQAICNAGHVYLYASGDTELSCMAFANLLLKLGIHSSMGNLLGQSASLAHSVRKNDVVAVVSYRGSQVDELKDIIPIIKGRKAKLVLVSTRPKPLNFDLAIRLPAKETVEYTGTIATYYSQECIRFVFNCIYSEVFELNYQQSSSHKLAIDQTEGLQRPKHT